MDSPSEEDKHVLCGSVGELDPLPRVQRLSSFFLTLSPTVRTFAATSTSRQY